MNRRYITKEQLANCINNSPYNEFTLAQIHLWITLHGHTKEIPEEKEEENETVHNG